MAPLTAKIEIIGVIGYERLVKCLENEDLTKQALFVV